jgi:tetratricopeptide (TPR) repeat protein
LLELLLVLSKRIGMRLLVPGLATVLALIFLYGTVHRNRDWRSNETIFRATLAENPDTMRVHHNLATTYDYFEGNLPGARRHYEAVLAILGNGVSAQSVQTHLSLAEVLVRQGAYQEALQHFGRLASLAQNDAYKSEAAQAALGMGECFLALGNYGQASQAIQQAVSLEPALGQRGIGLLRGNPLPTSR